ncbi:squalene/phytoene synthase [Hyphomicrobium denitrificans 1NES1]|uniref:Squalene/phytoene synthase n=1 Tax=Hyphomicrobium denitrificans 1NES1 TaxID=670307 RepID=N0BBR1_9HYPH|nr:squalene/phytoene synthase family protein [Hyphomicrobium denitrificans]AGK57555.1 squalene/phytoene synthase [Hyphomicrobium denitrificans 1NES1]
MRDAREAIVNIEAVRSSARLNAPDRYYAALFAPASVRGDLIALAAFDGEITRIAQLVSDAALGEIRIAWWRDALLGSERAFELTGNPVLDQFADVVRRHKLSNAALETYFNAHMDALFADPPADDLALNERFRSIDGTPLAFALQILYGPLDADADDLIGAAGRASGLTRIALTLPYALAAGRAPLPEARSPAPSDMDRRPQIAWLAQEAGAALQAVRRQLTGKTRDFTTALLPLALIEPYFRALQKPRHEPSRDIVEIAPLARLWRIARAHWTGAL